MEVVHLQTRGWAQQRVIIKSKKSRREQEELPSEAGESGTAALGERIPMKMLQSLNNLASKISPGSPTDGNANKVHMHNNNNNNNNDAGKSSLHPHPYSKKPIQQLTSIASQSSNGDQKENT